MNILPPEERHLTIMNDNNELSHKLMDKFSKELTALYELRVELTDSVVKSYDHDLYWYYRDSSVPNHVIEMLVWNALMAMQKDIVHNVLIPLLEDV